MRHQDRQSQLEEQLQSATLTSDRQELLKEMWQLERRAAQEEMRSN